MTCTRLVRSQAFNLSALAWLATALPGLAGAAERSLDVPYVPTPQNVVDRMLELGEVDADDYVIDLGSGDGRIAVTAAAQHGARALGVDLNPERIAEAEANAEEAGVTDRAVFRNQDLFDTDISEATVLTMYLLPSVNMKLRPRLFEELAPGTHVVSHAFDMQDWEPDVHEQVDGRAVYLWIIPEDVSGSWQVGDPAVSFELEQTFQKLSGTATRDGDTLPVTGQVSGQEVTLQFDDQTWTGHFENNAMIGHDAAWHAVRQ